MDDILVAFTVLILSLTQCVLGGKPDYCNTQGGVVKYCEYGCCDDRLNYEKCCAHINVALVIGAVVGTLVFIAILAGVVAYCFICKRNKDTSDGGL
ncbi:uncharacterized protein LOC128209988 isoform X2 [Mya arenaria]|uniref:uncharacterized protein LOC128209988 isoform X2 n=1 Tax=Mya arenaria TaxID=6604 RepID=UPI0022E887C5|nr:uncharacterized protein LOC128209988 isoform X2 [Mya arenaria]